MNFCTDISSIQNRTTDFLPHESRVLLSQSMDQGLNGRGAHLELLRHLFVRRKLLAVDGAQEVFERFECGCFPLRNVFPAQPVHSLGK
jgi:hypothetical protein